MKGIGSVEASCRILTVLGDGEPLGVTDLSDRVGLGKGTVFRILTSLEAQGFVEQEAASLHYRLAPAAVALTCGFLMACDLRKVALPYLINLAEELGDCANLALFHGGQVIYVERVMPPKLYAVFPPVGSRAPLGSAAVSKAILATMDPDERGRLLEGLEFQRRTSTTLTSLEDLETCFEQVRSQGFAVDNYEFRPDLVCYAAPVRDRKERVKASIGLSRITSGRVDPYADSRRIDAVVQAGQAISGLLGYV